MERSMVVFEPKEFWFLEDRHELAMAVLESMRNFCHETGPTVPTAGVLEIVHRLKLVLQSPDDTLNRLLPEITAILPEVPNRAGVVVQ